MEEIWMPITDINCMYSVSNYGRVLSYHYSFAGRILKPSKDNHGYLRHTLQYGGKKYYRTVHSLVAEAFFIKPEGENIVVDHIDGNILNNHTSNLQYITSYQNTLKANRKNKTSIFVGVSYHKGTGKWRAKINKDNYCLSLGLFDSEKLAHEAYCMALKELHNETLK